MLAKKGAALVAITALVTFCCVVPAVETSTHALTETRLSALIAALPKIQIENPWSRMASMLIIMSIVGVPESMDATRLCETIAANQNITTGGFPSPADNLYGIAVVVEALNLFGHLDYLNRTALIQNVLTRYNASSGAFHEPDQWGGFPIETSFGPTFMYDNILSTAMGVKILAILDALSVINTTKTMEWILRCRADNHAFMPHPYALYYYFGFDTDSKRTGLPYTFCGIKALQILNNGSLPPSIKAGATMKYIVSCQKTSGGFTLYPGEIGDYTSYTFYAVDTLVALGLDASDYHIREALNFVLEPYKQQLAFDASLHPLDDYDPVTGFHPYGIFIALDWEGPLGTTFWTLLILNRTRCLGLLAVPTPRAQAAWTLIIEITVAATLVTLIAVLAANPEFRKRFKDWLFWEPPSPPSQSYRSDYSPAKRVS